MTHFSSLARTPLAASSMRGWRSFCVGFNARHTQVRDGSIKVARNG